MRESFKKTLNGWQFESADDLSAKSTRDEMPKGEFADPKHKKFPIPDKEHAILALRYQKHASPEVRKRIHAMAAEFGVGKGKEATSDQAPWVKEETYPGQGIKNTGGVISKSNLDNPQFTKAYKKELEK